MRQGPIVLALVLAAWSCGSSGGDGQDLVADQAAPDAGTDSGAGDDADVAADLEETWDGTIPAAPDGPGMVVSLSPPDPMLPFPWNWFTTDDPSTPTGLRLNVSGPLQKNVLIRPVMLGFRKFIPHSEMMDGFGPAGLVGLPVATDMEGGNLPAVTGPASLVEVFLLAEDKGFPSVPFWVTYARYPPEGEPLRRVILLDPVHPLEEHGRYLVVVRKGLVDGKGEELRPWPLAEAVLGVRPPFGPPPWTQAMERARDETVAALSGIPGGPAAGDLLLGMVYTIGTMMDDFHAAADVLEDEEVEVDLDPDGDGKDNVLPASKVPGFTSSTSVSVVVTGRFSAPDFRDEDGILRPDESGAMTVRSHQWRDFYLAFPAEGAAEPFPLATVEHGLNSYKETMYAWVRALAARGIASASFDFMYHAAGKRGGFQFMAVDAPRKAADNIRQSALDILSFEKALRRLSEERDLYPIGGDGKPDLAPERVAYTGHSLGAIVSSLTCPISSGARVAGMANGGGDYVHVFTMAFTKLGMIDLLPGDTVCAFDVLGSHIMSVADPVVLARRMSADPDPDHGPCPFLLLVSLEDMTVPGRCGYEYTVAAGTPVIEPLVEPWEYTTSSPAAATLSGTIQFHGGHELINGGDGPELEAQAQEVLFHYLESFLETGTPQIVWPAGE